MKDDFYIEAYEKYREELNKSNFYNELQIMPYDTIKLPLSNKGIMWIYSELLSEHTRQLSNDINSFRRNLIKLDAWNQIISEYDEKEKLDLMVEFIDPLTNLLHDLPYSTNNRFIFSLSHLCHQANRYIVDDWEDDLVKDSKIRYKTMKKHCSNWKKFDTFLVSLKTLSGEDYSNETNEFRNRMHHRIPINTEIGFSNTVLRDINDKKVNYSFGYIEPTSLKNTLEFMRKQHLSMCNCFIEYEKILVNQIEIINKK